MLESVSWIDIVTVSGVVLFIRVVRSGTRFKGKDDKNNKK